MSSYSSILYLLNAIVLLRMLFKVSENGLLMKFKVRFSTCSQKGLSVRVLAPDERWKEFTKAKTTDSKQIKRSREYCTVVCAGFGILRSVDSLGHQYNFPDESCAIPSDASSKSLVNRKDEKMAGLLDQVSRGSIKQETR